MFIEAKCNEKFELPSDVVDVLPKELTIATSVQFIDSVPGIKKQLEDSGVKVSLVKGRHSKHNGQILGCDFVCDVKGTESGNYLYIGDGLFHAKSILLKGAEKVFVFNPLNKQLTEINDKDINKIKKKMMGALLKFKTSTQIGVIITKKSGQQRLNDALEFKKKYEEQNKTIFLFLCNTLDFSELENFPFIDCWVNTMCPRIGYDDSLRTSKPILNIDDVN
tara:strand:+ start:26 stop:688 length:663 start_codon:yes stop_codon:yes gene_type:complete